MKTYFLSFGAGDPRNFTGLNATFLNFQSSNGTTLVSPAITEVTGSGIYTFNYGVTSPIAFLADAATTSPGAVGRYVIGSLDPADRADEYGNTLVAIGLTLTGYGSTNFGFGTTLVAIGTSLTASGVSMTTILGNTASSIGSTGIDPTTVMGFLLRSLEVQEGGQTYTKATGILDFFTRGATLIREKTITDTTTTTTKS